MPKRSFFTSLYLIFEHAGWSHSIRNHKYLVSGMKNGPRAELWAYLRWSEARSVIWGHPMFTISWWTWSFLTKLRLTWLQVGKKIRKEHSLQFGQSTPSGIYVYIHAHVQCRQAYSLPPLSLFMLVAMTLSTLMYPFHTQNTQHDDALYFDVPFLHRTHDTKFIMYIHQPSPHAQAFHAYASTIHTCQHNCTV